MRKEIFKKTVWTFIIPFLLLVIIVIGASTIIIYLQSLETLSIEAENNFRYLQYNTIRRSSFSQGIDEEWHQIINSFEYSLNKLNKKSHVFFIGRVMKEKIEKANDVWLFTKERLIEEDLLFHQIAEIELGKELSQTSYADLVEAITIGKKIKLQEDHELWQFYRLQDSLTDLAVSGEIFTTNLNQINKEVNKRAEWLINIIIIVAGLISLLIISLAFIYSKNADKDIFESKEKFKSIFNSTNDGLLIINTKTKKFIDCNKKICAMLEYSSNELKRMGIKDIHPKKDFLGILNKFEKFSREKTAIIRDIPLKKKRGDVFFADIGMGHVKINGEDHIISNFIDLTPHKRMEEKMSNKIDQLNRFVNVVRGRERRIIELKKELAKRK
jgi:PAS domain S-box-containing protein